MYDIIEITPKLNVSVLGEVKGYTNIIPKGIISIIQSTHIFFNLHYFFYFSVTYWLAINTAEMTIMFINI